MNDELFFIAQSFQVLPYGGVELGGFSHLLEERCAHLGHLGFEGDANACGLPVRCTQTGE
jgi:hypothetical protein